jgi:hypothetical protein
MGDPDFTVALFSDTTSMIVNTLGEAFTATAFMVEAASAVGSTAVVTEAATPTGEVTSMAEEASTVEVDSTAEDAGKFHFLAAPCGAHTRAK